MWKGKLPLKHRKWVTLTVRAWYSQAAPSLQRCGVAEPTKSWGAGIPLHVQSPRTHWQTKPKQENGCGGQTEMINEKETYFRYQIIKSAIFIIPHSSISSVGFHTKQPSLIALHFALFIFWSLTAMAFCWENVSLFPGRRTGAKDFRVKWV